MRRLLNLGLILATLTFVSCIHTNQDSSKSYQIEIKKITLKSNEQIRDTSSIAFDISVCVFANEDYINSFIDQKLSILLESENTDSKLDKTTLEKKVDNYVNNMKENFKDVDDSFPFFDFYYTIEFDTVYHKRSLVTIREKYENFTGGAHGNHNIFNYTFDLNSKTKIEYTDIFENDKFLPICEDYFLKSQGIEKQGTNLDDAGFWFKENKFYLPDNFYFENDNVIFIYNPYEIASYAQGYITIEVPIEAVKDLIKDKYKFILN